MEKLGLFPAASSAHLEPSSASLGTHVLGFVVAFTTSYIGQHPMAGTTLAAGLKLLGQSVGLFSDFT